jgi:membrane-associated protease RseP (regulator of RpoE activity)
MRTIAPLALLILLPLLPASEEQPYPIPSDDNPATEDATPFLGVNMSPPPVPVQRANNIAADEGVYVRRVYDDTTAAAIGVQRGDVIVDINGEPIDSMTAVRDSIFSHRVGDDVAVTVLRDGQRVELTGTLGGWPESIPMNAINAAAEERYRQMQAKRLADEKTRIEQQLEQARQEVADSAEQTGAAKDEGPEGADPELGDPYRALQRLGGDPVLPSVEFPRLAALFHWQLDFALHCADPVMPPNATPIPVLALDRVWDEQAYADLRSQLPEVTISYTARISSESL